MRHGLRGRRAALLWIALLAVGIALLVGETSGSHEPTDVVTVGGPSPAPTIPSGFLGLSLEYTSVANQAGLGTGTLNTVFAQLIRNLNPGGRPVLRIGGDSTDHAWVPAESIMPDPGLNYAITPYWLASMRRLVDATDPELTLGIDLEADTSAVATVEAQALTGALGADHVAEFEVGNEPSLYAGFPWYTTFVFIGVHGRLPGWDPARYVLDFTRIAHALPPGARLAGPALGDLPWMPVVVPALVRANPTFTTVTYHTYPLLGCFIKPRQSRYPTIPHLLSVSSSDGLAASVVPLVQEAAAEHRQIRIDELNSVTCAGRWGVSDTFASALWMLDTLNAMARAGVSGVNVHTFPDAAYRLFAFSHAHGRWTGNVAPEYYAMLMFDQSAPAGSRLLSTSTRGPVPIRAWATRGPRGTMRVTLINDSPRGANVVVHDGAVRTRRGTVWRLTAPSLSSVSGVDLGGQSFGTHTTTGVLPPPHTELVDASGRGGRTRYSVSVPADSAAVLMLSSGRDSAPSRPASARLASCRTRGGCSAR